MKEISLSFCLRDQQDAIPALHLRRSANRMLSRVPVFCTGASILSYNIEICKVFFYSKQTNFFRSQKEFISTP